MSYAAFVSWARSAAVPIASCVPTGDHSDLLPIMELLRGARVIGLGEATHGTREFFQLKHRIHAASVDLLGSDTFALESSLAETLDIDSYVRTGTPPADLALAAQRFWTWDTEEVAALMEDLRARNAQRPRSDPLRFVGVDVQYAPVTARLLRSLLVAAGYFVQLDGLAQLSDATFADLWPRLAPSVADGPAVDLAALRAALDTAAVDLTGEQGWLIPMLVRSLTAHREIGLTTADALQTGLRDEAMADLTLAWAARATGPLVLWAHSGHISRRPSWRDIPSLGTHLEQRLGDGFRGVGFTFGSGGFRAIDWRTGVLGDCAVGLPAEGSLDAALDEVGLPVFALDLHSVPPGPVSQWLSSGPDARFVGAGFAGDTDQLLVGCDPRTQYDVLIHVAVSSPTRPRPTGRRISAPPRPRRETVEVEWSEAWHLSPVRSDDGPVVSSPEVDVVLIEGRSTPWPHASTTFGQTVDAEPLRERTIRWAAEVLFTPSAEYESVRLVLNCVSPTGVTAALSNAAVAGKWSTLIVELMVAEDASRLDLEVRLAGHGRVLLNQSRFEVDASPATAAPQH